MYRILVLLFVFMINLYSEVIISSDTNPDEEIRKVLNQMEKNKELKQKEKNIHPLKREFGYFVEAQGDVSKAIYYLCKDDKNSLETIIKTKSLDLLKESSVTHLQCDISGRYSLLKATISLKKLDIVKLIVENLTDIELQSKYLQKLMTRSIGRDMSIYRYLYSSGVVPNDEALKELSLYGTLEDIKSAISLGIRVDTNETAYLRYALQRDTYAIAKFYMENYDFDLNIDLGSSRFPSYLLYIVKLDSSKKENLEFFKYFVSKLSKESLEKHGAEFLQRVKDINPKFYMIVKDMQEFKE